MAEEPDTAQKQAVWCRRNARDTAPVGVGSAYRPIREAAEDLLWLFNPDRKPGGNWGCGLVEIIEPTEDGHRVAIVYPVASAWRQERNALTRTVDVGMIRATGIALLAYAEANDPLASDEEQRS